MNDINKIIEKERYWLNLKDLKCLNFSKMQFLIMMIQQDFVREKIFWLEAARMASIVFQLYNFYIERVLVINIIK